MTHQTFKVAVILDESVECFYIKHYIDECQPILQKFKSAVFQRNPSLNSPLLKVYWIDGEGDNILINCEEDFRLYIEQLQAGHVTKIFFSVSPIKQQQNGEAMETEDGRSKLDRKSRKGTREEEKQRREAKKWADKMRHYEDKLRVEQERSLRNPERDDRKKAERVERAKKKCDRIRQIIGSIDPANLHSTSPAPETSLASNDPSLFFLDPATVRLLSNAVAGCLQPCKVINTVLSEIMGMVPQPASETDAASAETPRPESSKTDQQQQTESSQRHNTATNTSDFNTPVPTNPSNQEIVALFKEAAKELNQLNDIASGKTSGKTSESSGSMMQSISSNMEQSTSSGSATTVETAVEKDMMVDSTASNVTIINATSVGNASFSIIHDVMSMPAKSRDSSIEVHDVNSMMSDESREWTMLDASSDNEQDESVVDELEKPSLDGETSEKANEKSAEYKALIDSVSTETQTIDALVKGNPSITSKKTTSDPENSPEYVAMLNKTLASLITNTAKQTSIDEIRSSIQRSIASVGEMNNVVKNSIASAQASLENMPVSLPEMSQQSVATPAFAPQPPPKIVPQEASVAVQTTVVAAPRQASVSVQTPVAPAPAQPQVLVLRPREEMPSSSRAGDAVPTLMDKLSATTKANLAAQRKTKQDKPVVVYDPNPKINAAVTLMTQMGFTNEGGWLTQLVINVDGDVAQAINFLTPREKL